MKLLFACLVTGVLLSAVGCGSEDCLSICDEAQSRDCTSIDDCNTFCSRTETLADRANCNDERDAWEECAASVDACEVDDRCNDKENAFASCAASYCLAHPGADECMID